MFIETRKVGKKKKYYLVHSFRIGESVKKIRGYLGSDLNTKELEEKKKKAKVQIELRLEAYKRIYDPLLKALSKKELDLLKELEEKSDFDVFHLSEKDWQHFSEVFTYNTNAIEGSDIAPKEVRGIIENDRWPKSKSKEGISETYGVNEAIGYIRKTKEHISLKLIKELHRIVFKNSKEFAGKLRPKGTEVVIRDGSGNIVHKGAPSESITDLLRELIRWYNRHKDTYPPLILAAVVHNQFENIHPFQDGNGRIGRLLLNNILIKHALPPVNIDLKKRATYYATLQAYEHKHDLRPTIELLLKEYRILKKELGK